MIEITLVSARSRKKVRIPEIPKKKLSGYKLIGTGEGFSPEHCLFLAQKYEKGFFKRVAGYRLAKPRHKKCAVAVSFYEKK